MAGLRSAYELQKWSAIRKVTSVPIQKVLEGIYNPQDIMAIGDALEQYDELAHSIFTEGLRVAEKQAKDRVDSIQEHRTLVKKPPLSARQLAIIYAQAQDRAQQKIMPELLAAIREIMEAQQLEPQPGSADGPHLATEADAQRKAPKIKPAGGLARFTPERAANEELPKTREEILDKLSDIESNQGSHTGLLDLLRSLVENTKEKLGDKLEAYKKDILDIKALVDSDAKQLKLEQGELKPLGNLLKKVQDGTLFTDLETRSLHLAYTSKSGQAREVVAENAKELGAAVRKQLKADAAETPASTPKATSKVMQLITKLFGKQTEQTKKAVAKRDAATTAKQGGASKKKSPLEDDDDDAPDARRADKHKSAFASIQRFLARRYNALRSMPNRGMELAKLTLFRGAALAALVTAGWDAFTKDFDFVQFAKDMAMNSLEWLVEKVKGMLGLDKKRNLDGGETDPKRNGSIAVRQNAEEVREGRKIIQKDLADGVRRFTPEEAARIEKAYYVKIPKDRIAAEAVPGSAKPVQGTLGSGAVSGASKPAGTSPADKEPTTASAPKASSGLAKASTLVGPPKAPESTASVSAAAPVASAAARSSVATPPVNQAEVAKPSQVLATTSSAAAVTATAPALAQAPTAPAPAAPAAGASGGSPVSLGSIPNGSHNQDASFALNVKSM